MLCHLYANFVTKEGQSTKVGIHKFYAMGVKTVILYTLCYIINNGSVLVLPTG